MKWEQIGIEIRFISGVVPKLRNGVTLNREVTGRWTVSPHRRIARLSEIRAVCPTITTDATAVHGGAATKAPSRGDRYPRGARAQGAPGNKRNSVFSRLHVIYDQKPLPRNQKIEDCD